MTFSQKPHLIGGLEPWIFMNFHSVGNVIIPTDFHSIIFQRGRSTANQSSRDVLDFPMTFFWDE